MRYLDSIALSSVLCAAVSFGSTASAAIVVTNQHVTWDYLVASPSRSTFEETFSSYADGFHPSPLAGTTGPVNWQATAVGGLYSSGGVMSTNNSNRSLTFTFTDSTVQGVGGLFFGTDTVFNPVSALMIIQMGDGTSSANYITNATTFTGFFSTGAAITSITLSIVGNPPPYVYASVDTMWFSAVPAPGALALLAAAGMIASRRQRA